MWTKMHFVISTPSILQKQIIISLLHLQSLFNKASSGPPFTFARFLISGLNVLQFFKLSFCCIQYLSDYYFAMHAL